MTDRRHHLGPAEERADRPAGGVRIGGISHPPACCLEGRAPLAAGLLAALRPGREGPGRAGRGRGGEALFFWISARPSGRRGVLVLIETILSAFRDTIWFQHTLFRPLTAAGTTLAVELAYALQMGLTRESAPGGCWPARSWRGSSATTAPSLLREASVPRRRAARESDSPPPAPPPQRPGPPLPLRELRRSGPPRRRRTPPWSLTGPAEVVCRGCALRDLLLEQGVYLHLQRLQRRHPSPPGPGPGGAGGLRSLLRQPLHPLSPAPLRHQHRGHCPAAAAAVPPAAGRRAPADPGAVRPAGGAGGTGHGRRGARPPAGEGDGPRRGPGLRPQGGQRVCGDSLDLLPGGQGKLFLLLSDGMGRRPGGPAGEPDDPAAGGAVPHRRHRGGPALRTVNTALNLRGDEQGSFTTIDLLQADLQGREGGALQVRAQPPPTSSARGSVRRLTGAALPAGLQDTAAVPPPARFPPLEENTPSSSWSATAWPTAATTSGQDLLAGWQGDDPNVLVLPGAAGVLPAAEGGRRPQRHVPVPAAPKSGAAGGIIHPPAGNTGNAIQL